MAKISIPGKVFLLGEYGILGGGSALLAAVPPKFDFEWSRGVGVHPESPAGKWLLRKGEALSALKFTDPTSGGFGASTAQFLAAWQFTHELEAALSDIDVQQCWLDYRSIVEKKASGADLVAQAVGESCLIQIKNAGFSDETIEWSGVDLLGAPILIFSVAHQEGRKVATHQHLADFDLKDPAWLQELDAIVMAGVSAIQKKDPLLIGKCFTDFARSLREKNLEIEATTRDLEALTQVKGVLGAKGCGALQADAMAVVYDPLDARNQDRILDFAKKRDWKFVSRF